MTFASSLQKMRPMWSNPVIVRDMRVRMRGTRAFWNQAFYLFILSVIAVFGYFGATTHNNMMMDPVTIQRQLQQFYTFIFMSLAGLITLIAPALTAVSIINEKKMQTFDLLVTTPMTSMQLLVGKLVSSIAFIVLLLVLSIPASALCIILGGSTISDVLQSYALLLIDGVLLASIGLAFSCSVKQPLQAIVATYGIIVMMFVICSMLMGATASSLLGGGLGAHRVGPASLAIAEFFPFFAAMFPGVSISIFGLTVPSWAATGVLALILVRLILTGAALKLGMYGGGLVASLRRQILLATAVILCIVGQSFSGMIMTVSIMRASESFAIFISIACALSLFFLPGLFVPAGDEDAAPGEVIRDSYSWQKSFSTDHSGALPFFHLWLIVAFVSTTAALSIPSGATALMHYPGMHMPLTATWQTLFNVAVPIFVYISGVGFLYWCIARRAAWVSLGPSMAKGLTFLIMVFLILVPFAILSVQNQMYDGSSPNAFSVSIFRFLWLLYPYTTMNTSALVPTDWTPFYCYGLATYALGTLIYAPWSSVTLGRTIRMK